MKRFRYRLERVLDFREAEKKEKERELAFKNAELHSAEARLDRIVEAQDKAGLPDSGEITMADVLVQREFQQGLRVLLEEQRQLILQAAEAVDQARNAYLEKAVEAETLVAHKEKKFEEHREERRRSERKSADELTIMRFKRAK